MFSFSGLSKYLGYQGAFRGSASASSRAQRGTGNLRRRCVRADAALGARCAGEVTEQWETVRMSLRCLKSRRGTFIFLARLCLGHRASTAYCKAAEKAWPGTIPSFHRKGSTARGSPRNPPRQQTPAPIAARLACEPSDCLGFTCRALKLRDIYSENVGPNWCLWPRRRVTKLRHASLGDG